MAEPNLKGQLLQCISSAAASASKAVIFGLSFVSNLTIIRLSNKAD